MDDWRVCEINCAEHQAAHVPTLLCTTQSRLEVMDFSYVDLIMTVRISYSDTWGRLQIPAEISSVLPC